MTSVARAVRKKHTNGAAASAALELVPPVDVEAEGALLGACILEPARLEDARPLESEDFYSGRHAKVWRALEALTGAGRAVDVVTVGTRLRELGHLDAVGGLGYLTELTNAVPAVGAAHVRAYADRVRETARRRRLIAACQRAAAAGYSESEPVSGIVEVLAKELDVASGGTPELSWRRDPDAGLGIVDGDGIFGELPEPAYVVDPLLQRGMLTVIGAYGGSRKSWLAKGSVLAVGAGAKAFGLFSAEPGRALYLDYEAGTYECRRRFKLLLRGLSLSTAPGVRLKSFPRLNAGDGDFGARFALLARSHDLIVIDTWRACARGIDENDSRIRDGLDELKAAVQETHCAVVVIVHARKLGTDGEKLDPREVFRGSSAIYDAADAAYLVVAKQGQPVRVTQTKSRTGRQLAPFEVSYVDVGPDAHTLTGAFVKEEPKPKAEGDAFDRVADEVLRVVKKHPCASEREVCARIKARAATVRLAIERLIAAGRLVNTGSGKKGELRAT